MDDDCDGTIDEDPDGTYYRDNDGDSYGVSTMTVTGCSAPGGFAVLSGDCNDADRAIHPAAAGVCDGVDNNCSGTADDAASGCACLTGQSRACGPPEPLFGLCRRSSQACVGGAWPADCVGAVYPAAETCDGLDNDCDGSVDEDFDCVRNETVRGDTMCGNPGSRACTSACTWVTPGFVTPESASTCDYCDDSGRGIGEEAPFATETWARNTTTGWDVYGNARYLPISPPRSPWVLTLRVGDAGALYDPAPVRVGYGPVTVTVRADTRANTDGGGGSNPLHSGSWSLVLLTGTPDDHLSSSSLDALPVRSRGLAVTWRFETIPSCAFCYFFTAPDMLHLWHLPGGGTSPAELGREHPFSGSYQDGPSGTAVQQYLSLRITPDDLTTPSVDETAADVVNMFGTTLGCANSGATPCGLTISPGDEISVGVVASTNGDNRDVSVNLGYIETAVSMSCDGP